MPEWGKINVGTEKVSYKKSIRPLVTKGIAEAVGTFALVFFGCGAISVSQLIPGSLSPQVIPMVFGLVVAAMIYAAGHISGAHFNPAVTAAFAAIRRFPFREVPVYWLFQFSGALAAIGLLSLILPGAESFGATIPKIDFVAAFLWEVVLSFFLMFVITAVATDARAVGVMAGAAIGATVCIAATVGGPLTGASMNPARSLAPLLFESKLEVMWLYALGPLVGACIAAFLYEFIRCEASEGPDDKAEQAQIEKQQAKGCC
jgi:MIP family channel proteins